MNKILRFTFVAAMALISSLTFAQNTVTFTAGTDKGADGGNPASDVSLTKEGITLHATNASGNAGVLGRTDNYRFYKNSTLEISSTVGTLSKSSLPVPRKALKNMVPAASLTQAQAPILMMVLQVHGPAVLRRSR